MSHPHDIHDRINALCAQARRLAPKVADQALDSGCTNDRPTGPRQAKAWDLVQEAFALNETTVADEYSIATLNKETNDMTPCPNNPDATHKAGVIGRRTCAWCDDITTEETTDMTHYAEASKNAEPIDVYEQPDGRFTRYEGGSLIGTYSTREAAAERFVPTQGPIPVIGFESLADAIEAVASADGLRYLVRNTHTGMLWATDTPFADVDEVLWDNEKGL